MIDRFTKKIINVLRRVRHARAIASVRGSSLFASEEYRAKLPGFKGDPATHYVLHGEASGIPPSSAFDPNYYRSSNPDVAATGTNLLLHYERFGQAEGRRGFAAPQPKAPARELLEPTLPPSPASEAAALIASDADFDVEAYNALTGKKLDPLEAAAHYLSEGEDANYSPGPHFEPKYYRERYPDVAATGVNLFLHFIKHGRNEGRSGIPLGALQDRALKNLNRDRETVILVVHETSRTGAPILGLNLLMKLKSQWGFNVITISWRGGGEIEQAFVEESDLFIAPPPKQVFSRFDMDWISNRLVESARPRYCIANSAVAHEMALSLTLHGVPVVGLVHEFATLFHSTEALRDYFKYIGAVVFPTEIVRASAMQNYPFLSSRQTHIIPQGKCTLPSQHASSSVASFGSSAGELMNWGKTKKDFTVAGLGTVEWRKGVDLFIGAAASFRARFPEVPCRFVWIGNPGAHSTEATMYLSEQLSRSNLDGSVVMLPATADLDSVYKSIDVLFVSSRLDPLPNVAIDAMSSGIPVVSFDRATGVADALRGHPELSFLIAPYVDSHAAAGIIHELATNVERAKRTQDLLRELAARLFDMDEYVAKVDAIARQLAPAGIAP